MDAIIYVVIAVVCLALGFIAAYFILKNSAKGAASKAASIISDAQAKAESIKKEAEIDAKDLTLKYDSEAKEAANEIKQQAQADALEIKADAKERLERAAQREEVLDRRQDGLDALEEDLKEKIAQADDANGELQEKLQEVSNKLFEISGLSKEEARDLLLENIKEECVQDAAAIIQESEKNAKEEADRKSREILSVAIQKIASDFTAEATITSVSIPSDDIKGKIIGREGRNIRTFEQITGVDCIIDDTPETVTLSSFDPMRREAARITLENLIADGRIHPARIEETFSKALDFLEKASIEAGKKATFDLGIHNLDPELVKTLGRLKYRTSYGQNVLQHSIEVANIATLMASELGLDPTDAKRAGLLHDLGKAIDREVEGSHAIIGAELAKKYGESPAIIHAIEAHHNDVEPSTLIAVLVQAADAVSAARPGARRESYESYIKRLEKLEEIAFSHEGVAKTYAMQAGRELRVMVEPSVVDDAKSSVIAHEIAKEIENTLQYPGQVHVVVIRETRSEDIAK